MRRALLHAARGTQSNDAFDRAGVLVGPAQNALTKDRIGVARTDATANAWLDLMNNSDHVASGRTEVVRLAPARLHAWRLADYTQEELIEGFEAQEPDLPPFILFGAMAKHGKAR